MAITKRQNSKNYYSEFVVNGKRFIKSTGTPNKTLASKIDIKFHQDAIEQSRFGGQTILLKDALEKYRESIRGNEKRKRMLGYTINWINENMDTNIPMTKVDSAYINNYVELRFALGNKPATIRHNVLIFSGTISLVKKLGFDVCTIEMPSIKVKNEKDRILTPDEEEKLLKELLPIKKQGTGPKKLKSQYDLFVMVKMLLETGARWSEISGMKWEQVDYDNKLITLWRDKTSKAVVLPISDNTISLLNEMTKTCDWIFPNKTDDGPRAYNRQPFDRACKRANIEGISFHSLRHQKITEMCKAGLNLQQVMSLSGHSTITSLMRYSHLTNADVIDKARDLLR